MNVGSISSSCRIVEAEIFKAIYLRQFVVKRLCESYFHDDVWQNQRSLPTKGLLVVDIHFLLPNWEYKNKEGHRLSQ
jgi:hypothetical protein